MLCCCRHRAPFAPTVLAVFVVRSRDRCQGVTYSERIGHALLPLHKLASGLMPVGGSQLFPVICDGGRKEEGDGFPVGSVDGACLADASQ